RAAETSSGIDRATVSISASPLTAASPTLHNALRGNREQGTEKTERFLSSLFPVPCSLRWKAMNNNLLKVFSGRANVALAEKIAQALGDPLGKITLQNFPDGETWCRIEENVRGRDVFVVQPTCTPVNENLME